MRRSPLLHQRRLWGWHPLRQERHSMDWVSTVICALLAFCIGVRIGQLLCQGTPQTVTQVTLCPLGRLRL